MRCIYKRAQSTFKHARGFFIYEAYYGCGMKKKKIPSKKPKNDVMKLDCSVVQQQNLISALVNLHQADGPAAQRHFDVGILSGLSK